MTATVTTTVPARVCGLGDYSHSPCLEITFDNEERVLVPMKRDELMRFARAGALGEEVRVQVTLTVKENKSPELEGLMRESAPLAQSGDSE